MLTRRHVLASALAAPAILRLGTGTAHAATTLKISHQFPGGTVDKGDFRDRLTRMFAAEVAKRSGGDIAAEIYPNSSLIKTNAQFSAMRKGALDISLYPLPYAGGELPACWQRPFPTIPLYSERPWFLRPAGWYYGLLDRL